ncbi:MAG: hypothetical protein LBE17_12505 [Treponema sp.]|nr:hypothetical protein [Treponema sp.]
MQLPYAKKGEEGQTVSAGFCRWDAPFPILPGPGRRIRPRPLSRLPAGSRAIPRAPRARSPRAADPGLEVPDPGLEVPDPGLEVPDPGLEVPDPGLGVPDPGLELPEMRS